MATNSKIKKPSVKTGSRIQLTESVDYNKNPPVFSLERIQSGKYCFSALDQENKAQFAEAIFKRRTLSWSEIQNTQRHGLGIEKIDKQAINASMPPFITEDCDLFWYLDFMVKSQWLVIERMLFFMFYGSTMILLCMITVKKLYGIIAAVELSKMLNEGVGGGVLCGADSG